jgi:hypothetical protein
LKGGAGGFLALRQRRGKMGRGVGARLGCALKRRRWGLGGAAPRSGRRRGWGVWPEAGPGRGEVGSSGVRRCLDRRGKAYDVWASAQY